MRDKINYIFTPKIMFLYFFMSLTFMVMGLKSIITLEQSLIILIGISLIIMFLFAVERIIIGEILGYKISETALIITIWALLWLTPIVTVIFFAIKG